MLSIKVLNCKVCLLMYCTYIRVAPPKGGTVKTIRKVKHQSKMGLHNIISGNNRQSFIYVLVRKFTQKTAYRSRSPFALELLLGSFYGRLHRPLSRVYPRCLVPSRWARLWTRTEGLSWENAWVSVQVSHGGS